MNGDILTKMLEGRALDTAEGMTAALREAIQQIALLGLSRTSFFSRAAFYGGTALRIFHGLDRFSEDMDFSLLVPDDEFDIFLRRWGEVRVSESHLEIGVPQQLSDCIHSISRSGLPPRRARQASAPPHLPALKNAGLN